MSTGLFFPIHLMLRSNSEVATTRARRGFTAHRVRRGRTAETGAVFLAVNAEAPIADSEGQTRIDQRARIAFKILFESRTAKSRSLRQESLPPPRPPSARALNICSQADTD